MVNERIQQLAEQSGLYFYLPNGNAYPCSMSAEECEIAYTKFAKSIVRECVLISRTSTDGFSAGRRMEEHFGVEE